MVNYDHIIRDLESALLAMPECSERVTEQLDSAIGHCQLALQRLREEIIYSGFPDTASEIYFFKEQKPRVYSQLLYYQWVFEIESQRVKKDIKSRKKYLQYELKKNYAYLDDHRLLVQYYRNGHTYLDELFFLRKHPDVPLALKGPQTVLDEQFSTWQDQNIARIMACDLLMEYLQGQICKLTKPGVDHSPATRSGLNWTGSKISLVELIYALQSSGDINQGRAGIKELAALFEQFFNIDLKDYYRSFQEIKIRKIEQTKFLDHLKSSLLQRLEDSGM